jgi:hypothetical protein
MATVVVLGGLLTAVVLNMLVVPALFPRYGVDRPGTAGGAAPRGDTEPVLEGVGEAGVGGRADGAERGRCAKGAEATSPPRRRRGPVCRLPPGWCRAANNSAHRVTHLHACRL